METQVAVLLGLGIPLGMAAIATKASRVSGTPARPSLSTVVSGEPRAGSQVWRLFATKTRPEVASAYAWAYSICTVAFVVLLGGVAAISGTKPASVALLLGYEALLIAENALSRSAVVSSKSFR